MRKDREWPGLSRVEKSKECGVGVFFERLDVVFNRADFLREGRDRPGLRIGTDTTGSASEEARTRPGRLLLSVGGTTTCEEDFRILRLLVMEDASELELPF